MAQRPQPSLRLADGGSFITRWAQSVMRPNATAKRLREADAPPPPPAAPVRAPAPPPPNPNATPDNPAGIRFQDGGQLRENPVGEYMRRVGEEWSRSNADFEGGNPGVMQRVGRVVNPLTGFGSSVGAMYDAAGSGDVAGMALAAGSSFPAFAATRTAKTVAGPLRAASIGGTAVRAGQNTAFGAGADYYTPGLQDGGMVPGTGSGDKIPAKYEPGEFVVSNDMIDDNPGLREQLSGLRAETLAARGKTVEEADAKALNGGRRPSLRAVEGLDPLSRMAKDLTGQNPLPPRSPMGSMADDLARNAATVPDVPPRPAGPGNPNVPPGGSAEARAFQQAREVPVTAPPSPAVDAPMPAKTSTLRNVASAVGNGILYGGAALGGAAVARGASGIGAPGAGSSVTVGERQPGDSATSTQIPIGGNSPAPDAQPYNFWTGSEAGRNIGNAANAIAPLGGVAMAARVPGAASKAFGVADAALGGLSAGIHNERASANTATSAATTLRTRPEDTFAGPPAAAAGAASPATDPGAPRRVDRPGQSPLFTNVADDAPYIGNNALMARGNGPNAQNMRAADNLAATDSLRSQGAALSGQSGSPGVPAMPQTLHSGNSWEARNNLRNLAVSASSPTAGRGARRAYQAALAMDTAARTGSDPGSVSRTNAQASMFGSKASADASKETSRNSLRGTMYSADSQLGGKQMESQQKLRQQQMMGELWKAAEGKPEVFQQLAMQYGMSDAAKTGGEMAAARQTRAQANVKDARSTFENMFTRDGKNGPERDANAEAMANQLADQIAPGYSRMSVEERAAVRPKIIEATRMVQGMNTLRNSTWSQKVGVDDPTPAYSQMPDLNGAQVGGVGWLEGAAKADVGRGDTKITLRDGTVRYLPKGQLTEAQERILEENGAKRAK